jgi:hypothetical protein
MKILRSFLFLCIPFVCFSQTKNEIKQDTFISLPSPTPVVIFDTHQNIPVQKPVINTVKSKKLVGTKNDD